MRPHVRHPAKECHAVPIPEVVVGEAKLKARERGDLVGDSEALVLEAFVVDQREVMEAGKLGKSYGDLRVRRGQGR